MSIANRFNALVRPLGPAVWRSIDDIRYGDSMRLGAALFGASIPGLLLGRAALAVLVIPAITMLLPAMRDFLVRTHVRKLMCWPAGLLGIATFFWWLVSTAFSQEPLTSLAVIVRMAVFIAAMLAVVAIFAERTVLRRRAETWLLAGLFVATTFGALAINVAPGLIALLPPFPLDGEDPISRYKSFMSVLAVALPVVLWIGWRRGGGWLLLALMTAMAGGFVLWGDGREPGRSAIVGLSGALIVVGAAIALRPVGRDIRMAACGLALVVAFGVGSIVMVNLPVPPVTAEDRTDPSIPFVDFHRQAIWGFTLDRALDRPVTGYGINTINKVENADREVLDLRQEYIPAHPHNWVLEVLSETGVPGLLLLLASQIALALSLFRAVWAHRPGAVTCLAVLTAFWTSSLANFSIWTAHWQVVSFALFVIPGARLLANHAGNPPEPEDTAARLDWRRALLLAAVGALTALLALTWYVRKTNEGYILYKRMKAENAYVYDEIRPRYLKVDPGRLIRIDGPEAAETRRADVIAAIWGAAGLPEAKLPARVETMSEEDSFEDRWAGAVAIRRLTMPVGGIFRSVGYLLEPKAPNGRGAVYAHGYAGTVKDARSIASALLAEGYTLVMIDFPNYGNSRFADPFNEHFGPVGYSHDYQLYFAEKPMRFYIEPAIVAANHLRDALGSESVDIVGFSAGGWVAGVAAAADTRFRRSVSVASFLPFYLRERDDKSYWPGPHLYQPLTRAANYLELPVLAAAGEGRAYLQIFNRYDRCCYRNSVGTLYQADVEAAARATGAGAFGVAIDETHATHSISAWGRERIVEFFAEGEIRPAERHPEPPRDGESDQ